MNKIYILFFALTGNVLIAQTSLTEIKRNIFQDLNSSVNQNYVRLINEGMTEDVKNKFYAFSKWQEFDLHSKSGDKIVLDSANYHIHDDIMLFVRKGNLYYIYPEEVDKIIVRDKTYTSYTSNENITGYYEILVSGTIQLLKKHKIAKEKVSDQHPLGISQGEDSFSYTKKSDFYYYDTQKAVLKKVPKKKKNIMRVFSKNRREVMAFVKENKLNGKSEEHLISLFSHYNDLNKYN